MYPIYCKDLVIRISNSFLRDTTPVLDDLYTKYMHKHLMFINPLYTE